MVEMVLSWPWPFPGFFCVPRPHFPHPSRPLIISLHTWRLRSFKLPLGSYSRASIDGRWWMLSFWRVPVFASSKVTRNSINPELFPLSSSPSFSNFFLFSNSQLHVCSLSCQAVSLQVSWVLWKHLCPSSWRYHMGPWQPDLISSSLRLQETSTSRYWKNSSISRLDVPEFSKDMIFYYVIFQKHSTHGSRWFFP